MNAEQTVDSVERERESDDSALFGQSAVRPFSAF